MLLHSQSRYLLIVLSAFVALGPLSTDMYLPALPAMVDYFDSNTARLQLTISVYLAGFAFFHLLCGPLSDRFGRKPILLIGLVIFAVASVGCVLAESVEALVAWRFLQGVGACTGPTLSRAMVRDIYGPVDAVKGLAIMAAIMTLAPVIAPTVGGWMLVFWNWQSIFVFLGVYALLGIFILIYFLPESLAEPQSLKLTHILTNYIMLLRHRVFFAHVFAASLLYAGALAFISGVGFVLIDFMSVAPQQFGLWFMFIVLGFTAGNIFTARFAHRIDPLKLMRVGALLGLLAGSLMVGLMLIPIYHPLSIVLPVALYTCGVGITMPNAIAAALAPFPQMAGTASALMGFVQMGVSALAGLCVGYFLVDDPLPMALTIAACGGLSLVSFIFLLPSTDKLHR